jgi:hypothetical protein
VNFVNFNRSLQRHMVNGTRPGTNPMSLSSTFNQLFRFKIGSLISSMLGFSLTWGSLAQTYTNITYGTRIFDPKIMQLARRLFQLAESEVQIWVAVADVETNCRKTHFNFHLGTFSDFVRSVVKFFSNLVRLSI